MTLILLQSKKKKLPETRYPEKRLVKEVKLKYEHL